MQDSVAAPGAPREGKLFGLFGRHVAQPAAHCDIFFWEGIGPTQGAHGDVMRGPKADARQCQQIAEYALGVRAGGQR